MRQSEHIHELAAALAKAQGQIEGAKKDSANPFFKSHYADLASVWDACRGAMAANGVSVLQSPRLITVGEQWLVEVETVLMHASGQFIADVLAVPLLKLDAQAIGSATTYARRYALAAFAGVAPEDDDGECAVGRGNGKAAGTLTRPTAKHADDPLERAKSFAADYHDRTPDQIYADAKKFIAACKPAQIDSARAQVQRYQENRSLTDEHVETLRALINRREEELAAKA